MNMKLFLVEDELEHVEKIRNVMEEFADFDSVDGEHCHISVEYLPGELEEKEENREFRFYDDKILAEIQNKINDQSQGDRIGLLLDIVLTQEEWISKYKDQLPQLTLAPEIYRRFQGQLPIYIITTVSAFYTKSEKMMGVDLSDRFVDKTLLTDVKLTAAIQKLQNFYVNWYKEDAQKAVQK